MTSRHTPKLDPPEPPCTGPTRANAPGPPAMRRAIPALASTQSARTPPAGPHWLGSTPELRPSDGREAVRAPAPAGAALSWMCSARVPLADPGPSRRLHRTGIRFVSILVASTWI